MPILEEDKRMRVIRTQIRDKQIKPLLTVNNMKHNSHFVTVRWAARIIPSVPFPHRSYGQGADLWKSVVGFFIIKNDTQLK